MKKSNQKPEQVVKITELTDDSPMPFGAHAGTPMQEVPAGYLLWLWDKEDGMWRDREHPVAKYIVANFSALTQEHPDHIVNHTP